ncbi:MAG: RNA polymerase sigma factor [Eubacteriales bacterium]
MEESMTWLSRYVRGRLRNRELTEDIVQEIYIKAYRAYDEYEESGRLKGWLVRIADNTVNGYFGSREAHCPACVSLERGDEDEASLIDLLPSLSPTPEEEVQSAASVSEILKVLDRLPVTQRTVFVQRIILDRDVAEVARMLQMAPGTVKSNTHHAVQ